MTDITDIIVTTPRASMELAAEEAANRIAAGGGFYFRTFTKRPGHVQAGSKVFYTEDGYIRGFAVVTEVRSGHMGPDWSRSWNITTHRRTAIFVISRFGMT